ncbi:hypothetical protein EVAR_52118_1 [Eumeta japonica]|uniref:Uncharacterized protein n=1 Tax=Eumeta variegata TaxID=151549 RepID=A0A4C1XS16_EUMVA|nr:hypothetical protein EVAR_52118_1 [Eumeta japonica]
MTRESPHSSYLPRLASDSRLNIDRHTDGVLANSASCLPMAIDGATTANRSRPMSSRTHCVDRRPDTNDAEFNKSCARAGTRVMCTRSSRERIMIESLLTRTMRMFRLLHMYILRKWCAEVIALHCGQIFFALNDSNQHT